MRTAVAAGLFVFIGGVYSADAGGFATFTTPPRGSSDRTRILDLMRKPMESVFGKPIEFDVRTISVSGNYAFAWLHPQRPGGAPLVINFPCEVDGRDLVIEATFVRKNNAWVFDTPADGQPGFCADDVTSWDGWLKEKGLPPQFAGRAKYLSDSD